MNISDYPLWTAIITPLSHNGDVDYTSLGKLLKEQEEAGNGVLVLGSTGEALNLDQKEREKILDYTIEMNLGVPLMVGVGGINLKETLAWVKYLETKAVHCYLMVTPLYAKPGAKGQAQWFKTLMDASTRPVMLYNVPSRTGCPLHPDAVRALASHPHFWAVKEASGSTEKFAEYKAAAGNARVYSGDDPMLPSYVPLGAQGLVSVASNVWPKATHRYVRLALNNELDDPGVWQRSTEALFVASNPVPAKFLLHDLGRITAPNARAPLTHEDMVNKETVKKANEDIEAWYKKNK